MSQTLNLFRLQQTDSQIDRISARLQVIQKTLDDDITLRLANNKLDEAVSYQLTTNRQEKEAEAAVLEQRIKIEQTEASLYGGKGYSPKELQDMQNDVAALKRHLSLLEDEQLNAMMAAEEAENRLHTAQSELETVKSLTREQNRSLMEEQSTLQKELLKFNSERAANSGSIPAPEMELYDRLRQQRRGIAVAVISDKSCSACGSGLSPAQIQASRSPGQMALCPSCGRILYGN